MARSPLAAWLHTTGMETVPDAVLLRRYVNGGDRAALELLVRRHADAVWTACKRVARHHADAEDAFQATFLTLARRGTTIRRQACLAGWLYRVAVHAALKTRLRAAKLRTLEAVEVAAPAERGEGEVAPAILEEVSRLAERYRLAVVLCDLEGRTQAEAAKLLGWKLGTLSGRLTRARRLLRSKLTRRGLSVGAAGTGFILQTSAEAVGAELIRAALATVAAPAASPGIVALSKGALAAIWMNKLKWSAAVMAIVVMLGAGAGTCWLIAAEGQPAEEQETKPAPRPPVAGQEPTITIEDGVPTAFPALNARTLEELDQKCPLLAGKVKPPPIREDSPLLQLARARLDLVLREFADRRVAYTAGRMTSTEMVRDLEKLKLAVDDLYRGSERRPWYREHVLLARLNENLARQRYQGGSSTRAELLAMQAERLAAEMELLRIDDSLHSSIRIISGNISDAWIRRVVFRGLDWSQTGRLTREDFPSFWSSRFDSVFDTNRDGFVDFEEFKAGFLKMREADGQSPDKNALRPGKERK